MGCRAAQDDRKRKGLTIMGLITVAIIHHDHFHKIEEDPEGFGRAVVDAIRCNSASQGAGAFDTDFAITLMPCVHSGDSHLYLVTGNTIVSPEPEMLGDGHWAQKYLRAGLERMGITWRPKWGK